jgi:cob(I)alamin adenosyltransferase
LKLYTKTGDDGTTGLIGGDRTSKTSDRIIAIGEVDELNAVIGFVRTYSAGDSLDPLFANIQNWLFDTGAELACRPGGRFQISRIGPRQSAALEQSIDAQTAQLPELRAFILPGGSNLAAQIHLARAVCRRAERAVTKLHETEPVSDDVRRFLNRLSDWLFVSARTANQSRNVNDIEWTQSEEL